MTQDPPPADNPYARQEQELGGSAPAAAPAAAKGPEAADEAGAAPAPSEPAELTARLAETQDQLLRTAADLENFRKRSRRELDEVRRQANDRMLAALLPVIDNLARAIEHAGEAADPLSEGVRMVLRQFHDVLAAQSVVPFVSLGTPFDPARHEAIGQEPSRDLPPFTVLRELQQGYLIGDRLLRAARVVVAQAPAEGS